MEMFLWGFLACALLDVIVVLFWRDKFIVALERVDAWIEEGRWD